MNDHNLSAEINTSTKYDINKARNGVVSVLTVLQLESRNTQKKNKKYEDEVDLSDNYTSTTCQCFYNKG